MRWDIFGVVLSGVFAAGPAWSAGGSTPRAISVGFEASKPGVRAAAASRYGEGCVGKGRERFAFRRLRGAQEHFEVLLGDPSPAVRLAALSMQRCFRKEKVLQSVAALVFDSDEAVSLEAMTVLAHAENKGGVSSLVKWLKEHQASCVAINPPLRERCIFAVYALGQCGQHETAGAAPRERAAVGVSPFLEAATAKLREVASVALVLVGGPTHRPLLQRLITAEQSGAFPEKNEAPVIEGMKAGLTRLP